MSLKNCKKILLIAGLLCAPKLFAQKTTLTPKPKPEIAYMYAGLGGGIGFLEDWLIKGFRPMSSFQTTVLLDNSWGIAFGTRGLSRLAENTPRDYDPGLCILGSCLPKDRQVEYSLRAVRSFSSSRKQMRFALEAGPSVYATKKAVFTHYIPEPGNWFSSMAANYDDKTVSGVAFGFAGRAKVEFPLRRYFGAEIAGVAGINNFMPYTGIEFLFNLGVLKAEKEF